MKSKYTLIDFWAWWCAPCRADIPNLKKVYTAFQNNGFNILSISTDPNEFKWKQALREENTSWTNGIQEGNPSKNIFGIIAIPAYILLNDKAEIIQMDMNSTLFAKNTLGTMNGSQVFLKDSKKRGLRGDDLYQVIEGLLGKGR
ncbi:Thiol-disulfide oxidoreductase ResA [compost metagenome]